MTKPNLLHQPHSLQGQLLLRISGVVVLLLLILGGGQFILLRNSLLSDASQFLQSRFRNVEIVSLARTNTDEAVREMAPYFIEKMIDTNVSVTVINRTGEIIAESESTFREDYRNHLLQATNDQMVSDLVPPHLDMAGYLDQINQAGIIEGYQLIKNPQGISFMVQFFKVGDPAISSGLLQLSTPVTDLENELFKINLWFCIISLIIIIVGAFILQRVIKRTLRPLSEMTKAVGTIHAGMLDTRLTEQNGQDEVDQLADAFNSMLERIKEAYDHEVAIKEKMRSFVSDASHEFRTPLTSIRGFAEVLGRGAARDEQHLQRALRTIIDESDRLGRLVNNLLTLARIDQQVPVEMKLENLGEIIQSVHSQMKLLAGTKNLALTLEDDVWILANRDQIKQVLINLIQNALSSTSDSGNVKVRLHSVTRNGETAAELQIADDGRGMPEELLANIFDRFYRVEAHRTRTSGGFGLGLSIVKAIVDAHNAAIDVSSRVGQGTTFTITFRQQLLPE